MDQDQSGTSSLDVDAVNLAKAIRQVETGGNFNARGKSGEFGGYQFTQPTWDATSKKYGINVPLEQSTREQQNEVAYKQIKEWKDKGHNVGEIASMWNSGKPDAYLDNNYKGTNKFGVTYDVPKYATSVATAYQTIKNGGNVTVDPQNPSSTGGYITSANLPEAGGQEQQKGFLGTNPNDNLYGKIVDNDITRKLIDVVPGAETLGTSIGTLGGYLGASRDEKKHYDTSAPSVGKTALAGGEVVGTAATISGSGGLLGRLLKGRSALASPAVETAMSRFKMSMPEFKSLSSAEKLDALTESLKAASASEKLVLQKAIEEITPLAAKELGLVPGLLKRAITKGKGAIGGLIKGAVKQSVPAGLGIAAYNLLKKD